MELTDGQIPLVGDEAVVLVPLVILEVTVTTVVPLQAVSVDTTAADHILSPTWVQKNTDSDRRGDLRAKELHVAENTNLFNTLVSIYMHYIFLITDPSQYIMPIHLFSVYIMLKKFPFTHKLP